MAVHTTEDQKTYGKITQSPPYSSPVFAHAVLAEGVKPGFWTPVLCESQILLLQEVAVTHAKNISIKHQPSEVRTIPNALERVKIRREAKAETSVLVFLFQYLLRKVGVNVKAKTYRFVDFFEGFGKVEAVRRIFCDDTEKILDGLRIQFVSRIGYMGVNDLNGNLIVSADYLRQGDLREIYLDLIHELVHVKQFREGRKLFDLRYNYTERGTEIEAYRHAVDEARNLGMSEREIFQYLKTEWMSEEDHRRLAETLNIKITKHEQSAQ
ncbi:hypothetical protein ISS96_01050 [Candidatus Bathyarchaeota archaeon]|nr:hypothetical protein [Candidatus Bathyarchaeota archaeon]